MSCNHFKRRGMMLLSTPAYKQQAALETERLRASAGSWLTSNTFRIPSGKKKILKTLMEKKSVAGGAFFPARIPPYPPPKNQQKEKASHDPRHDCPTRHCVGAEWRE